MGTGYLLTFQYLHGDLFFFYIDTCILHVPQLICFCRLWKCNIVAHFQLGICLNFTGPIIPGVFSVPHVV